MIVLCRASQPPTPPPSCRLPHCDPWWRRCHGQYRCAVGKILPAGFACCKEHFWQQRVYGSTGLKLSFPSSFQLMVRPTGYRPRYQMPSPSVCLLHSQVPSPQMTSSTLLLNPTEHRLQDHSFDFNNEITTVHCSLPMAHNVQVMRSANRLGGAVPS